MVSYILRLFWKPILFTYLLVILENILALFFPRLLGEAIDGIMIKERAGLITYLVVFGVWILIGYIRRIADTRTFANANSRVSSKVASTQFDKNESLSKVNARISLSSNFVELLEVDFEVFIRILFSVIGSLLMIYFISPRIFGYCVIYLLLIFFVLYFYQKRLEPLITKYHTSKESTLNFLATKSKYLIDRHFRILAKRKIILSDLEANNYLISGIFMLFLLFASFQNYIESSEAITAGTLIAIFQYLNSFTLGVEDIPYITEKFIKLRDIQKRLENQ